MENYANNSLKARSADAEPKAEKKVEQVYTGAVVRRKKPLSKRFAEIFVAGDGQSVIGYIFKDVLVPSIQEMVTTAATQGIERMIFGESRTRTPSRSFGRAGHVSYNGYSSPTRANAPVRQMSHRARSIHDFDEIVLETRVEATDVLDSLFEILSKYQLVTVADMYNVVGISPSPQDTQFGWVDLRGSKVEHVREGYLLSLPAPEPVDR